MPLGPIAGSDHVSRDVGRWPSHHRSGPQRGAPVNLASRDHGYTHSGQMSRCGPRRLTRDLFALTVPSVGWRRCRLRHLLRFRVPWTELSDPRAFRQAGAHRHPGGKHVPHNHDSSAGAAGQREQPASPPVRPGSSIGRRPDGTRCSRGYPCRLDLDRSRECGGDRRIEHHGAGVHKDFVAAFVEGLRTLGVVPIV